MTNAQQNTAKRAARAGAMDPLRRALRHSTLRGESKLLKELIDQTRLDADARARICSTGKGFIEDMRANAASGPLLDAFLQEYGLSNEEGVSLMRLAEALIRTPDDATANALIEDRIKDGDWRAHAGSSAARIVNLSTKGLMLAAGWLNKTSPHANDRSVVGRLAGRLGDPILRTCVRQAMAVMGAHFVLGETIDAALDQANDYVAKGYGFSFDMLGEAARTEEDAARYGQAYADAIDAIAATSAKIKLEDGFGISVKLSALYPRYEHAQSARAVPALLARVRPLALAAKNANMGFTIDAEEVERLDLSLDVIAALLNDPALENWNGLGVAVQAYQRRALALIDWLAGAARRRVRPLMVRLVKGAYWDAEIKRAQVLGLRDYPVFTRKASTDVSYLACARKLLDAPDLFYPQFATHNAHTVAAILEMAGGRKDYEFQRLYGMGEILHDMLIEKHEAKSRIYAPVGRHTDLLAYLVRRLLENGANSSFVHQALDRKIPAAHVARDPIDAILSAPQIPNPEIPPPRDLFDGERMSARGWDLSDPLDVKEMSALLEKANGRAFLARPIIGGAHRQGPAMPVGNPAHRNAIVGHVIEARVRDVADAAALASQGAPEWAARPLAARAAILNRAADLLEERAGVFFHLAIAEAGKTWSDAVAELREAVDFCRFYAARAWDPNMEDRRALGTAACISPWNFPLAIFLGQVAAALAAGNAVLAKPADQTPLIAAEAVRLLHDAGVPGDVLHLLPGKGATIGAAIIANPNIDAVCFTGSTPVAKNIHRTLSARDGARAPLIAETGGVNAMIVDSTALIEQTVDDVITSAFQSAGQRCSALRVLCVQKDIADDLMAMLAGAMGELRLGNPRDLATDIGPVIDAQAKTNIENHIVHLDKTARRIAIAPAPPPDAESGGHFVRPVAYEVARVSDVTREVFGPVLHVARFDADGLDALVDEINAMGYGLTLGLQSRIDGVTEQVAARARAGNIYVNRNQIGAIVGMQPFGGEGLSGTGPKAGGPHYLRRLTTPIEKHLNAAPLPITLSNIEPHAIDPGALTKKIENASSAQNKWEASAQRGAILSAAARRLSAAHPAWAKYVEGAARDAEEIFDREIALPSPTGEQNVLSLHGRGVLLCLGGFDGAALRQASRAIAAKNAVLVLASVREEEIMTSFGEALERAGAPAGLLETIACCDNQIPADMIHMQGIAGIVFDGADNTRAHICRLLANRDGPILPLLSLDDDLERFANERTLTINTSAGGGNIALLSLPSEAAS